MARTKNTDVKELHPRDPDAKYFGSEPTFAESSKWTLGTALTWYGHFYDKKDSREFIAQYLELKGYPEKAKSLRRVHDNQVINSYGYLARCFVRGYVNEEHTQRLLDEIERMIKTTEVVQTATAEKPASNRPNVQEIMREKTHEAGGELEGRWDEYIQDGCKKENNIGTINILSQYNILPQHINILVDAWKKKLDEYLELQSGKDEQLNEAYARFGKIQIRNIISTIESVIADLNSYINIKKAGKKPRAKKPVSVEKIVRSLKYLKTFKLDKLELVSIPPTKLHGCAEAWVYDTKKRKLHHYVADDYAKSLTVKGNSVLGFCTKNSEIKTLRKPETQIKEVMGSKPAARKFFDSIKAVSVTPNGRFNADMVILRAF